MPPKIQSQTEQEELGRFVRIRLIGKDDAKPDSLLQVSHGEYNGIVTSLQAYPEGRSAVFSLGSDEKTYVAEGLTDSELDFLEESMSGQKKNKSVSLTIKEDGGYTLGLRRGVRVWLGKEDKRSTRYSRRLKRGETMSGIVTDLRVGSAEVCNSEALVSDTPEIKSEAPGSSSLLRTSADATDLRADAEDRNAAFSFKQDKRRFIATRLTELEQELLEKCYSANESVSLTIGKHGDYSLDLDERQLGQPIGSKLSSIVRNKRVEILKGAALESGRLFMSRDAGKGSARSGGR